MPDALDVVFCLAARCESGGPVLGSIDQPTFPVKLNHSSALAAKVGTATILTAK
jgi:hypothetical protein